MTGGHATLPSLSAPIVYDGDGPGVQGPAAGTVALTATVG
jgi:hypothetical protein